MGMGDSQADTTAGRMSWRAVQALFVSGTVALVYLAAQLHARFVRPELEFALVVPNTVWWSLFLGVFLSTAYALGLPETPTSRLEVLGRGGLAGLASMSAVSLLQLLTAEPLLPRFSILIVALCMPVWLTLIWNVAADAHEWSASRDRVLLVAGRKEIAAALETDMQGVQERPAIMVGWVPVDEARVTHASAEPLVALVEELQPSVIVLDREAQDDATVIEQVTKLHRSGVRVRTLALFYEGWLAKLPISELAQVSLLFDIGELHRAQYGRFKRLFDIVLGVVGIAVLGLVLPVVVVGNSLGNRGPLFFRQERVGRDGTRFAMLKFRSMVAGSDSTSWTTTDDVRVTRFGGFLRRTHLDELPQVWNILRGELSIVGPRPEQVHYVEELASKIPFYDARHLVRPGLTGWAQVSLGYTSDDAEAMEKLQYDFFYLRRQSAVLDFRVVVRTIREVVAGLGR